MKFVYDDIALTKEYSATFEFFYWHIFCLDGPSLLTFDVGASFIAKRTLGRIQFLCIT